MMLGAGDRWAVLYAVETCSARLSRWCRDDGAEQVPMTDAPRLARWRVIARPIPRDAPLYVRN